MMNSIAVGAFLSGFSVILGAFGTHSLREKLEPALLQVYETSTHYLFMHAFAMILYGVWRQSLIDTRFKAWPPYFFLIGSILFSGSLYLIVFTGERAFGMITPVGGLFYIVAWIGFGIQAFHHHRKLN
jgi:uncharacterized membrane protein YgdD (TMEM256/DUF423 family)